MQIGFSPARARWIVADGATRLANRAVLALFRVVDGSRFWFCRTRAAGRRLRDLRSTLQALGWQVPLRGYLSAPAPSVGRNQITDCAWCQPAQVVPSTTRNPGRRVTPPARGAGSDEDRPAGFSTFRILPGFQVHAGLSPERHRSCCSI